MGLTTTGNVAWDGRLASFKGKDTAHYVTTAAGLDRRCAACRRGLAPGEQVSLLVDIAQSTAPDGHEYLTFTDCVCHRGCSDPVVMVRDTPWEPDNVSPLAVRAVFTQKSATGRTRVIPVLAFTLVPVVTYEVKDGEPISALVSLLLSDGFALAMNPDYTAILKQAQATDPGGRLTVTSAGLLRLAIDGELLYREQLDPQGTDDAEWLQAAAQTDRILVISGDNLVIKDTGMDLHLAARHGTLVTGAVALN